MHDLQLKSDEFKICDLNENQGFSELQSKKLTTPVNKLKITQENIYNSMQRHNMNHHHSRLRNNRAMFSQQNHNNPANQGNKSYNNRLKEMKKHHNLFERQETPKRNNNRTQYSIQKLKRTCSSDKNKQSIQQSEKRRQQKQKNNNQTIFKRSKSCHRSYSNRSSSQNLFQSPRNMKKFDSMSLLKGKLNLTSSVPQKRTKGTNSEILSTMQAIRFQRSSSSTKSKLNLKHQTISFIQQTVGPQTLKYSNSKKVIQKQYTQPQYQYSSSFHSNNNQAILSKLNLESKMNGGKVQMKNQAKQIISRLQQKSKLKIKKHQLKIDGERTSGFIGFNHITKPFQTHENGPFQITSPPQEHVKTQQKQMNEQIQKKLKDKQEQLQRLNRQISQKQIEQQLQNQKQKAQLLSSKQQIMKNIQQEQEKMRRQSQEIQRKKLQLIEKQRKLNEMMQTEQQYKKQKTKTQQSDQYIIKINKPIKNSPKNLENTATFFNYQTPKIPNSKPNNIRQNFDNLEQMLDEVEQLQTITAFQIKNKPKKALKKSIQIQIPQQIVKKEPIQIMQPDVIDKKEFFKKTKPKTNTSQQKQSKKKIKTESSQSKKDRKQSEISEISNISFDTVSLTPKQQEKRILQYCLRQLPTLVERISFIGEIPYYCTQHMKKVKDYEWRLLSIIFYKYTLDKFKSIEKLYLFLYEKKKMSLQDYQAKIQQNKNIMNTYQKVKKSAQKKKSLPQPFTSKYLDIQKQILCFNQPQYFDFLKKQVLTTVGHYMKKTEGKLTDPDINICYMRMCVSLAIIQEIQTERSNCFEFQIDKYQSMNQNQVRHNLSKFFKIAEKQLWA